MASDRSALPDDAIARAFLLPPLAAGACGFLIFSWGPGLAMVMAVVFALVAVIMTMCVAYPLLLWLKRRGRFTAVTTMVSGALLGTIPAVIAAVGRLAGRGGGVLDVTGAVVRPAIIGSIVGLVSAGTFWLAVRRHVPRARVDG
jgi:hypothetical protein